MFTTFLSLVGIAVVGLILFSLFAKAKLQRRVGSWWGRQQDVVADKFGDKLTDHDDAISKADAEVVAFRKQVIKLEAEIDISSQKHADAVRRAEKWAGVAAQAAKAGDEANVKRCVLEQKKAEQEALIIAEQNAKNQTLAEKLQSQLDARTGEIETAKNNTASLKARAAGLAMRKSMQESSTAFGGSGSLVGINDLEDQLRREEAELDAGDRVTGPSLDDLERQYSVDTSVDDEVARLMAVNQPKKETVTQ